jgi:hypothetical protein
VDEVLVDDEVDEVLLIKQIQLKKKKLMKILKKQKKQNKLQQNLRKKIIHKNLK